MPKIGHGGTGWVLRWEIGEGDTVNEGDVLAEVELEKANVEVESPAAGRVTRLLVDVQQEVEVGTVIAHIERAGP